MASQDEKSNCTEKKPIEESPKFSWANVKEYLQLFWTMFLIGLTTFGGGYAMIAIIERELGEKKHWIESEELMDYIAVSQITPGVIAVNISTFVGYKRKGNLGGVVATLGAITPSLIIIIIIATLLENFYDNEYVRHAFAGIRVAVCALIVHAKIGFIKKSVIDPLTGVVFGCVFLVAAFTSIQTVYIVLAIIALSVIITLIKGKNASTKMDGSKGGKE